MMAAVDGAGIAPNISLLLAGHIHTFEAINYEKNAPPQILAGEGGDLLDPAPADLTGQSVGAMKISSGLSLPGYGFLLFTHAGNIWTSMCVRRTVRTSGLANLRPAKLNVREEIASLARAI